MKRTARAELIKGKLDCVFVSRELKPADIQGFHDAFGYDPLSIPISGGSYRHFGFLDSVGFMVNKKNPVDKLSLDPLDAVLSTTHNRGGKAATTWGDLRATGDWADKPIHIVGLQPWNGFEEFVRERVPLCHRVHGDGLRRLGGQGHLAGRPCR
ncbi:hypothetical protein ACWCP8_11050 [Streptomyces sp. NPDC002206]